MLCKQHEETIYNLISECPILAKNEYVMRHDRVGAHLQYSICKALGIETTGNWCTHTRKPVQCYDIKRYTQIKKLWQRGQI